MVEINGRQTKLSKDKEEAFRKFHELMASVHLTPEAPNARVTDLIKSFLSWSSTHSKPDTYANHQFYGQKLHEDCGHIPARDIRVIHVTRWIDKRKWSGWSEFCAKKNAKRIFSWAVSQDILRENPLAKMANPAPPPRQRALTEEEYRALLRGTSSEFRRFLFAMRQTGARPKELRDLKWDQVRKDHFFLSEHKTADKTRKPRIIYLTPVMQRFMAVLRKRSKSDHVFVNSHGDPWSKHAVRLRIQRLKFKLGLADDLCLYLARHSFASSAILNGVDLATVSELMGHSSTAITASTYVHLQNERAHMIGAATKAATRAKRDT